MTYPIWYGTQTTAICRPIDVGLDNSIKPLSMITLSRETEVLLQKRHEVWLERNTKSSQNVCESFLFGSTERLKIEKNTIFWKNFHLTRNTLVGFNIIFAPDFERSPVFLYASYGDVRDANEMRSFFEGCLMLNV